MERRDVPGFEGYYQADTDGYVWSCARVVPSTRHKSGRKSVRERRLSGNDDGHGYFYISLYRPGFRWKVKVHHVVALAFHGPWPEGAECVRHLNDVRGDNRPSNLAYGTIAENVADSIRNGTFTRAEKNGAALLTNAQVIAIKDRILSGGKTGELASEFGVSAQAISCLKYGRNWRSVGPEMPACDRAIFAVIGGVNVPLKKYVRRLGLCYESVRFRVRKRNETVCEAARHMLAKRAA